MEFWLTPRVRSLRPIVQSSFSLSLFSEILIRIHFVRKSSKLNFSVELLICSSVSGIVWGIGCDKTNAMKHRRAISNDIVPVTEKRSLISTISCIIKLQWSPYLSQWDIYAIQHKMIWQQHTTWVFSISRLHCKYL